MPKGIARHAARFKESLRVMCEHIYCIGAADENEYRAAQIDFLHNLILQLISELTETTMIPAKR